MDSRTAMPHVVSVNMSAGGIPKRPVTVARVLVGGLEGDLHDHAKHNTPQQAVSLIDVEDLIDLQGEGFPLSPGATGENVTVRGLSVDSMDVGDRLIFSGGVEIELTKPRQPCFVLDAIDPNLKVAIKGRCGYLARVVRTGEIRPGESIEIMRAAVPMRVR